MCPRTRNSTALYWYCHGQAEQVYGLLVRPVFRVGAAFCRVLRVVSRAGWERRLKSSVSCFRVGAAFCRVLRVFVRAGRTSLLECPVAASGAFYRALRVFVRGRGEHVY